MILLQAYSVYDREVGYCQGSPFIVGMLLMQVSSCSLCVVYNNYCHKGSNFCGVKILWFLWVHENQLIT